MRTSRAVAPLPLLLSLLLAGSLPGTGGVHSSSSGRGRSGGGSGSSVPARFLPFGFMSHAVPDLSIDQGANSSILIDHAHQAAAGFNLVLPYLSTATNRTAADARSIMLYLDRCHAVGLRVLYDLTRLVGYSAGRLPPLELLVAEVEAVRGHPAVAGWCEC
eukprot:SAG22_NODE_3924_length_1466_cov_1.268471_2_plen_161_part_00